MLLSCDNEQPLFSIVIASDFDVTFCRIRFRGMGQRQAKSENCVIRADIFRCS